MLRRLLSSEFTEFFKNLPQEQKDQFKAQLLSLLQNEQSNGMRKKLVDLTAEVSRNLMDDDGNNLWPEFLKFMFDLASSPQPHHKEISLLLFRYVEFYVKLTLFHTDFPALCRNFRIFLSLRFYVKPIIEKLEVVKLPFFAIFGALNFVDVGNFSLQKMQKFIKIKVRASECVKAIKGQIFCFLNNQN